jgi:regulator of RNase E activity RraA
MRVIDDLDAYTAWDAARAIGVGISIDDIRPMSRRTTFVGPAFPVAIEFDPNRSVSRRDYRLCDAIDAVPEGAVLVLDLGGLPLTALGSVASTRLAIIGAAGVVVNGFVRDVDGLDETGLAVFARGSGFYSISQNSRISTIGEPVRIDAYTISAGDLVFGCATGLVVLPSGSVDAVRAEADNRRLNDEKMLEEVKAGATFAEVWDRYKAGEAPPLASA